MLGCSSQPYLSLWPDESLEKAADQVHPLRGISNTFPTKKKMREI